MSCDLLPTGVPACTWRPCFVPSHFLLCTTLNQHRTTTSLVPSPADVIFVFPTPIPAPHHHGFGLPISNTPQALSPTVTVSQTQIPSNCDTNKPKAIRPALAERLASPTAALSPRSHSYAHPCPDPHPASVVLSIVVVVPSMLTSCDLFHLISVWSWVFNASNGNNEPTVVAGVIRGVKL